MEFGICLASRPQDLDHVVRAEELGFTHCWMADSQMIWSDVYAMLALAADRTTSMKSWISGCASRKNIAGNFNIIAIHKLMLNLN